GEHDSARAVQRGGPEDLGRSDPLLLDVVRPGLPAPRRPHPGADRSRLRPGPGRRRGRRRAGRRRRSRRRTGRSDAGRAGTGDRNRPQHRVQRQPRGPRLRRHRPGHRHRHGPHPALLRVNARRHHPARTHPGVVLPVRLRLRGGGRADVRQGVPGRAPHRSGAGGDPRGRGAAPRGGLPKDQLPARPRRGLLRAGPQLLPRHPAGILHRAGQAPPARRHRRGPPDLPGEPARTSPCTAPGGGPGPGPVHRTGLEAAAHPGRGTAPGPHPGAQRGQAAHPRADPGRKLGAGNPAEGEDTM
ncbi:MAG: Phytoene synthase, partial [uncultured Arthrobacter sp.]